MTEGIPHVSYLYHDSRCSKFYHSLLAEVCKLRAVKTAQRQISVPLSTRIRVDSIILNSYGVAIFRLISAIYSSNLYCCRLIWTLPSFCPLSTVFLEKMVRENISPKVLERSCEKQIDLSYAWLSFSFKLLLTFCCDAFKQMKSTEHWRRNVKVRYKKDQFRPTPHQPYRIVAGHVSRPMATYIESVLIIDSDVSAKSMHELWTEWLHQRGKLNQRYRKSVVKPAFLGSENCVLPMNELNQRLELVIIAIWMLVGSITFGLASFEKKNIQRSLVNRWWY